MRQHHTTGLQLPFPNHTEQHHVQTGAATTQKRQPLPPVILGQELIIQEQDSDFGRGDDQEEENEEGEPENVVELIHPEGGHYEIQFEIDGREGYDPHDETEIVIVGDDGRMWYRPRHGGGNRGIPDGTSVTEVRTKKHARQSNAGPQPRQYRNIQKWHRSTRLHRCQ
mmetsp:Transcript_45202/g.54416  ORF Transcript_45202/g.54416 Transcript_45202/m.54416 type:complete len:168 (-) Transcript_45202:383-886(-)